VVVVVPISVPDYTCPLSPDASRVISLDLPAEYKGRIDLPVVLDLGKELSELHSNGRSKHPQAKMAPVCGFENAF
jgi:hypothetical protein